MNDQLECSNCKEPAVAIDDDFEGYCPSHFRARQSSTEPIANFRSVE